MQKLYNVLQKKKMITNIPIHTNIHTRYTHMYTHEHSFTHIHTHTPTDKHTPIFMYISTPGCFLYR